VNHLNQFTSVTVFFNLKPDVAIGEATDFIEKAAAGIVRSACARACRARR
jgi:multidrug efflux pump subunit AcrB